MTDVVTSGEKKTRRPGRRTVSRINTVSLKGCRNGFEFTAALTVTGRTAASASFIKAMPSEGIWPEPLRRECLAKMAEMAGLHDDEGVEKRISDGYLSLLAAIFELRADKNVKRASAKPKPRLRVVGGYEHVTSKKR